MKDYNSIEELFKSSLENLETDPGINAWNAIQAKMSAAQIATTTTTVAGKAFSLVKVLKIAALVTGAAAAGLGIGYFAFNQDEKSADIQNQNSLVNNGNPVEPNSNEVQIADNVSVSEINSVTKQDKVVSILEVKKGAETHTVVVEVHTSDVNKGNSVVGGWLSKGKNNTSQEIINEILRKLENDADESVSTNIATNIGNEVTVQEIEENTVIPGIKASVTSGNAPLIVEFSNITNAASYEWRFDDKNTSKEATPSHTFTEPGNYVVMLTVKDSKGKSHSDKLFIEVKEKETAVQKEESSVEKFNVFSPNGDGLNETFIKTNNIELFEITIADSKGNIVFTGIDPSRTWNGQDRSGNLCPEGNYTVVYRATGTDKKQYKDKFILRLER